MPLPVRDLRLHRVFQRRPLEEMVRRGLPLRSGARQEDPGRGGLPERLRAEVRQHRAARHAVHGRYRHRHRRHVDQDRRQGDASSTTNGARSRRWSAATRPSWSGWASMYRTAGRPDAPWRYNGAFSPDSTQRLLGDKDNCPETCQEFVKIYARCWSERDPAKRTALTDRMVEIDRRTVDRRADHRGHGLLRDQHQEGRPVRSRSPAGTSSATCSSASRVPTQKPWKK